MVVNISHTFYVETFFSLLNTIFHHVFHYIRLHKIVQLVPSKIDAERRMYDTKSWRKEGREGGGGEGT